MRRPCAVPATQRRSHASRPGLRARRGNGRVTVITAMATAALLLTGCSSIHDAMDPPSTTRMVAHQVPDVELDDEPTAQADADQAIAQANAEMRPTQLWIRAAHWTGGAYDLTVAAPKDGSFQMTDGSSTDGNEPTPTDCTVTKAQPLTTHIAHALPTVDTQVTLRCPARTRATIPVLSAQWTNGQPQSPTQSVFTEGDLSAQGSPDDTHGSENSITTIDPSTVDATRVVRHGKDVRVTLWAPVGPWFTLEPTFSGAEQQNGPDPAMTCAARRDATSRMSAHGRQYRYALSCSNVKDLTALSLTVETMEGAAGHMPSEDVVQMALPAPMPR